VTSFTAVVMAAGQGTRMRSATPKVLHELCGLPMVAWPVRAAQEAGAGRVVVVTSPTIDLDGALPAGATIAVQPQADGTAGAVRAAMPQVPDDGGPVVVLSGDVPLIDADELRTLVEAHVRSGAAATVITTELEDPSGYGRVVRAPDGSFDRIVETKAEGDATPEELAIREVNTGVYAFDADALAAALPQIRADNAQGELYLPDAVELLKDRGVAVHRVDDPGIVLGINDRVHLSEVRAIAQRRILEDHMRAGVTIVDPATTSIDVEVELGQDAVIEPLTILRGRTVVGPGATVGPQVTATDATIGAGATVRVAWLEDVVVGERATVGPFAYLRPGTVLREGAKAGTFVEIKNSEIGAGAKVPHLSYIGDATVGPGSNLGAATITANYDPKRKVKHRTTLGADVKTGVDTTLVAPVTLHDRAYTAAGSVITEDVPEGALGIARERQRTIEGYADRP
jgi:bifunctional UDP-N-acetylglucosamine pyrophosphorylase/glucosamine-1-phosphate N-acetyltransferase